MGITAHARYRAHQRYNIDINNRQGKNLCWQIIKGEVKPLVRLSNSRTLYEIEGKYVVYSHSTKEIVTFLPRNCYQLKWAIQ